MSAPEQIITTLIDLYLHTLAVGKPDLLNYKQDGRWQQISSQQLERDVRNAALGLYSLGVRASDRVALLAENSPKWTIADLATLNCGAADVPIYATQSPEQIAYILTDASVEVLFISNQKLYQRVHGAIDAAQGLHTIVAFEPLAGDDSRIIAFEELLARGQRMESAEPNLYQTLRSTVTAECLATLIYTSGTTGEPKGVMLTHGNIVSNVLSSSGVLPLGPESIVLSFLPLSHIFERSSFYLYLYSRASIFYSEGVDYIARNLAEVRPHIMTSVPRLFEKILARSVERGEARGRISGSIARWAIGVADAWGELASNGQTIPAWLELRHTLATKLFLSKWREALGGRISYFISGGAPLSAQVARIFYGAGLPILQGYGLTESSPVITANRPNENRLGSVGKALPGVLVKIAEDGEILASGPNVMKGYFQKPLETEAALKRDADGRVWLHTGDIGYLDADGFLFITDRKKDLLKTSGGKYIAPQPIENAIKQSRFVNQVVVIGDERKFPAALIVPSIPALESYAALKGIAYSNKEELLRDARTVDLIERQVAKYTSHLSQFEKVKAIALIPEELTIERGELTPTLKVRRRVVVEKFKDVIDRMYAVKEEAYAATERTG